MQTLTTAKKIGIASVFTTSVLLFGEFAHGQVSFTDQTTFLTASGASMEALMPSSGNTTSQVVGGMTFTNHPPSSLSWGFVNAPFTDLTPGNDLAISGDEEFNIDFASPITSVGFDWVDVTDLDDTSFNVTFLRNGNVVESIPNFSGPDNGTLLFQGFVTSQPFDRIEIREVGDDGQNEVFGQFFTRAAESWVTAGSGTWDNGANWTGGIVPPTSTDFALIAPSTAVTVTGPAATTVDGLTVDNVGGGATTLNLQASEALTVTNNVYIGQNGVGSIAIPSAGTLNVGGDTNIENFGTLQLSNGATFSPSGATNLTGGTLSVDSTSQLSGSPAFTWNSGTVAVTGAGGFTATGGGPLGATVNLTAGQTLNVTNTVTNGSTIEVSGGTVVGSNIVNQSGVSFTVSGGIVTNFGTFDNTSGGITTITGGDVFVTSFDTSNGTLNFTGGSLNVDGGVFTPRTFAPGGPDFTLSGSGNPTLQIANGGSMDIDVVSGDLIVGATDDGTFNLFSGATATNQNGAIASSDVAATGTVLVDGAGSTWTNTGTLNVGFGTGGGTTDDTLTVDNGGAVVVNGTVTIGSTGAIHLDGGSITVNNGNWEREPSSEFQQHHTGGTLTINNGVYESGTGTYTLGGVGTPKIQLQNGATADGGSVTINDGDISIESGSSYDISGALALGSAATLNSKLTVTGESGGTPSEFESASAIFGAVNNSAAIVDVFAGGLLTTTGAATIGLAGGSTGTVTVNGMGGGNPSKWTIGSTFKVGDAGTSANGTLNVEAGAKVEANAGSNIGFEIGSTGTLKVTGRDSIFDADDGGNDLIIVGRGGTGDADVLDGGRIDAVRLHVGNKSVSSTGTADLLISGVNNTGAPMPSTVNARGDVIIGSDRAASLTVEQGAKLNTGTNGTAGAIIGDGTTSDGTAVVIDGLGSRWDHQGSGDFSIADNGGSSGVGNEVTFDITGGASLDADGRIMIGDAAGSYGVVTVNGDDGSGTVSRLDAGSDLFVGDQSEGFLNIEAGAIAETQNDIQIGGFAFGDGEVKVTGAGSQLISRRHTKLGDSSSASAAFGLLTIENGGTVQTDDEAQLGSLSLGTGTGQVNAGGIWNADSMYVGGTSGGQAGTGTLNVAAGGTVDVATELKVWNTGTVNLSGGTIETATLDVITPGDFTFSTGTLRFTGGKTLDATSLPQIFGTAPVPTLVANQHLDIDGAATINSSLRLNSGTLSVGSTTAADLVANLDWDAGTLNITAETLTIGAAGQLGQSVIVDQNQTLGVPNNTLTVDFGADLNVIRGELSTADATNNGLIVISNVSTVGDVDFDNGDSGTGLTNAVDADLVVIDSTVSGAIQNNGSIEMIGNVTFEDGITLAASSSLGFDIDGVSDFDVLTVGGVSTLAGSLDLDVNFSLALGDLFEIIDVAGTLSGAFVGLPDNSEVGTFGGVKLFIDYDGGDGNDVVLIAPEFTADFDLDGDVDGDDLNDPVDGWQARYGNDLDGSNFLDWQRQFGSGVPPLSASTTVPEPSSLLFAALGLLTLFSRRKCA